MNIITIENRHTIPITLYSFFPVPVDSSSIINVVDEASACFDSNETQIQIRVSIEQLENADEVDASKTLIYSTFLHIASFERLSETLFEFTMHSSEANFEPVDILLEFEIKFASRNNTASNDYETLRKEMTLGQCTSLSSTSDEIITSRQTQEEIIGSTTKDLGEQIPGGGGLSTGAIVGIVIGSLAFVILIAILVGFLINKNSKSKKKSSAAKYKDEYIGIDEIRL